jgi:glutamate N-acetyltransferase / amino-acid N-acetyltransferase
VRGLLPEAGQGLLGESLAVRNGPGGAVQRPPAVLAPVVPLPRGFLASGVHCGIKSRRPDLALVLSATPAAAAGMFTQIETRAPSVVINEERLKAGRAQAIVVNAGNANSMTGAQGVLDAEAMSAGLASALGIPERLVLATSTGVIGRPLPIDLITAGYPALVSALGSDGLPAAEAMRTTDAFAKSAHTTVMLGGRPVSITGIAKGAGMIHPDMATMIAVLLTDAAVDPAVLSRSLHKAVGVSFNCISVDGDTSTNDSVFLLANGATRVAPIAARGWEFDSFTAGLTDVCQSLARMIVADGEGTSRVVELVVRGARSDEEARAVGRTVMSSTLVKASFHGTRLNWGRIAAAAGRSGVRIDPDRLSISVGGIEVVRGGVEVDGVFEEGERLVEDREIRVELDLGLGARTFRGWTSDLSLEYVRFNSGELT